MSLETAMTRLRELCAADPAACAFSPDTPSLGLVEFALVLEGLLATKSREELASLLSASFTGTEVQGGEAEEPNPLLRDINSEFYVPGEEPFCLDGLNLACWFALCLDRGITHDFFLKLRGILRNRFDLTFLEESYADTTGFKNKIDLIAEVAAAVEMNRFKYARKLLKRLAEGFPATGPYFRLQAQLLTQELEGIDTDED